jgi:hypothetical protein
MRCRDHCSQPAIYTTRVAAAVAAAASRCCGGMESGLVTARWLGGAGTGTVTGEGGGTKELRGSAVWSADAGCRQRWVRQGPCILCMAFARTHSRACADLPPPPPPRPRAPPSVETEAARQPLTGEVEAAPGELELRSCLRHTAARQHGLAVPPDLLSAGLGAEAQRLRSGQAWPQVRETEAGATAGAATAGAATAGATAGAATAGTTAGATAGAATAGAATAGAVTAGTTAGQRPRTTTWKLCHRCVHGA